MFPSLSPAPSLYLSPISTLQNNIQKQIIEAHTLCVFSTAYPQLERERESRGEKYEGKERNKNRFYIKSNEHIYKRRRGRGEKRRGGEGGRGRVRDTKENTQKERQRERERERERQLERCTNILVERENDYSGERLRGSLWGDFL